MNSLIWLHKATEKQRIQLTFPSDSSGIIFSFEFCHNNLILAFSQVFIWIIHS